MPSSDPSSSTDAAVDALDVGELAEWVGMASVSRDATPDTMRAAAEWLATRLGPMAGRVEDTAGHPVVRGEWLGAPGAPTVLVYGHYDVQPTGDLAEWVAPPFELTVDGDVLRGRGVSDDKGPVYLVATLLRTVLEREGRLPLNVKLLIEGEEEIGSPHLPGYLADHAAELAADLVISADGAMWRPTEPSLSTASKGLATLSLVVTGADDDLHSGRYGGTVANPLHALVQLVAGLHEPDGTVAVPGFHDGIPELSAARRAQIAAVAFDDIAYAADLGVDSAFGEPGYSTLERLWERPTLEVNGVEAGGKYTVIPHRATAHVSCRLVPGQDPDLVLDAIREHLLAVSPPGVRVDVQVDAARVPAYTIAPDHPAIRAATVALQRVYPDQEVLLACIGGTLPATTLFEDVLGAKTLFFSFSTADEKLHAPGEFMRTHRLAEGVRAWHELLTLLADGPHRLTALTPATRNPMSENPYLSYGYLEAGVDLPTLDLAPEFGRVPAYDGGLSPAEAERATQLLDESLVISLHDHPVRFPADMRDTPAYNRTGRQHTAFAGLGASGMTVVFDNMMDGTACVTGHAPWRWDDVVTDLGMRQADIAHQHDVTVVRRVADIEQAHRDGTVGIVFGLEAATPIENEIDRLDVLYGLGLRQIGIAYSDSNSLGSGLSEQVDGGLTSFGHRAVRRMNQLGLAVDVSHSSDCTSLDVCRASSTPVLMTHAGARAVWDIPRMKPDDVLRAIADTGGVIGMSAAPHTTVSTAHPRHSIDSVMDHLGYCIDLVGIEHVAFGPDTLYGDHVGLHTVFAHLLNLGGATAGPPLERVEYVDGLENPTENFANICGWLVQHGFSDDEIRAVVGGNVLRALRGIWV